MFFTVAVAAILASMLLSALVPSASARRSPWLRRAPMLAVGVAVASFLAAVVASLAGN